MSRPSSTEFDRGWRLPAIEGRWVNPFVGAWCILYAIALISSGFALRNVVDRILSPVTAPQAMGFVVADTGPYPTVGTVVRMVKATGLASGDLILSVNGRRAGDNVIGFARQLTVRDGMRVTLLVQSAGGQRKNVVLVRDERLFRQELRGSGLTPNIVAFGIQGIRFLFGELLFLTAAGALMWNRNRDPLAPWASAMMVLFVVGSGGSGQWLASQLLGDVHLIRFPNAAAYSALAVILAVFPSGRFEPRWSILAAAAGIIVAIGTQTMSADTSNLLITLSEALGVATIIARYRSMPGGTSRQQMRWALLSIGASVVALLLATFCQFADGYATGVGSDLWLRICASIFWASTHALIVLGITVALLRYRLYDADAAITRSVAYSALTLGILSTFSISQKLIEFAENRYIGNHLGPMASTLGGMLAAAMIAPLRKRTTSWAERRFRGNLTRLTTDLPILLADARETMEPQRIAEIGLEAVTRGVRATRGAIVSENDVLAAVAVGQSDMTAWLASYSSTVGSASTPEPEADAQFPFRLPLDTRSGYRAGWLLLGPRPDGSLYGKEERTALHDLSGPFASALRIATDRHAAACRQAQWNEDQRALIVTLQRQIASIRALLPQP